MTSTYETPVLLSPNSVAKLLDISRSSVYALMENGDVAWVPFGADRRIHASEIERLRKEGIPTTKVKKAELTPVD